MRRLSCRALRTRTVILTNDTDCERIVYLGLVNRLLGHTHVDGPVEELFERCFRKKLLLNRNAKANQQQCENFSAVARLSLSIEGASAAQLNVIYCPRQRTSLQSYGLLSDPAVGSLITAILIRRGLWTATAFHCSLMNRSTPDSTVSTLYGVPIDTIVCLMLHAGRLAHGLYPIQSVMESCIRAQTLSLRRLCLWPLSTQDNQWHC